VRRQWEELEGATGGGSFGAGKLSLGEFARVALEKQRKEHHIPTAYQSTWSLWCKFLEQIHSSPAEFSSRSDERRVVIGLTFIEALRGGAKSGTPLRLGSLKSNMGALNTAHRKCGWYPPFKPRSDISLQDESAKLYPAIHRALLVFKKEDGAPKQFVGVCKECVEDIKLGAPSPERDPVAARIAAVIEFAFTFLLRGKEYRTLRIKHIAFHGRGRRRILDKEGFASDQFRDTWVLASRSSRAEMLMRATHSVSLTFDAQKNGVMGEVITLERSGSRDEGDPLCPVSGAARLVSQAWSPSRGVEAPLLVIESSGKGSSRVDADDITETIRTWARLHPQIYTAEETLWLSAHGLRGGGAQAYLNDGVSAIRVKAIGRWKTQEQFELYANAPGVQQAPVSVLTSVKRRRLE
jgi:hypothetical protein